MKEEKKWNRISGRAEGEEERGKTGNIIMIIMSLQYISGDVNEQQKEIAGVSTTTKNEYEPSNV